MFFLILQKCRNFSKIFSKFFENLFSKIDKIADCRKGPHLALKARFSGGVPGICTKCGYYIGVQQPSILPQISRNFYRPEKWRQIALKAYFFSRGVFLTEKRSPPPPPGGL